MKRARWMGWIVAIGLFTYLLTYGVFYFFQDKIVFQGKALAPAYQFQFPQSFEEHFIKVSETDSLNAILFRADSARGLIVYFHGNADNLQRWGQYAVDFTSQGYDVLMADYRGYGKSTGKPNEEILYSDAKQIIQWALKNIAHVKLVIYGRSLGAAVASHVATTSPPDLLILETPFHQLSGALYGFPARYNFSNAEFIPKITCKILILHGTSDWVVPLRSARKLEPQLKPHDQFIIIEGGGHSNLRNFELYHSSIATVLQ